MDSPGSISQPAAPVPGRRSVIPVVIVAGIALGLVAVGIIVWQLLNRPASAQDVAHDFVVATYEGDVEGFCSLAAPALIDPVLEEYEAADCGSLAVTLRDDPTIDTSQEAADIEVLESTESGDTATIRLSDPSGTPGVWTEVNLERFDDAWLVTDF
ncbi:DUF4878 domain-containing protein [Ornithinimicrobium murale]|uniref:DUF4878 domain-containing protein n=1 Tax=Ornithinimicrobium murale TaxID=1050153 RepID=UPI000E0D7CAF|nr:DUF4878 domain-containing protein [Ornithinimicrobium murale]